MRYRKRPDEVLAISVAELMSSEVPALPQWVLDALQANKIILMNTMVRVATRDGSRNIGAGGYVVVNQAGHLDAYAADEFAAQFEELPEELE